MLRSQIKMLSPVLFVIVLLALSLLLTACGSRVRNTNNPGVSSSTSQQITPGQTSSSSSSGNTTGSAPGNTSQQIQDAIQAIDNAMQDVNNADATATTESNTDEQP